MHKYDPGVYSVVIFNKRGAKESTDVFHSRTAAKDFVDSRDLAGGSAVTLLCVDNTLNPPRQKWEIPNDTTQQ